MKKELPKKVKDALIEILDDMEAMLGGAGDFEDAFCDGGDESFDTLNSKRIKIIRKHFDL